MHWKPGVNYCCMSLILIEQVTNLFRPGGDPENNFNRPQGNSDRYRDEGTVLIWTPAIRTDIAPNRGQYCFYTTRVPRRR